MTLPVLRRSAVQAAANCLFRYDQIWNQGVYDASDYALVGIGFHAAAHAYIVRLLAAKLPSDDEEARLAFPEGIAHAHTPARLVPEVQHIYRWWAEKFQLDLANFLAAEERQEEGGFSPDLVYGRAKELEILDFKTYWVPQTEEQLRNDFQARWYVYNAMRIWPNFPTYRFTHSYVRLGKVTSVEFQPHELATFADEVGAVAASIELAEAEGQWPATPGPDCGFCTLACPVVDKPVLIPQRLLKREDAHKAADLVLAGDQMLKQVKKALKLWVSVNGPIDCNGVVFDNRPSETRSYPLSVVAKVLGDRQEQGADFASDGITVSHSALAKIFKRWPEVEQSLLPYQQSRTTYRFGAKKPGDGDEEE